ncbi:ComEC/Rec2 family competence protein [Candidatus Peregrinibacteria bacterium]|nr:MAG: ComEC/Rec2 family competence protein [Candidatus Peregrinibacteria bacterium]
MERSTYVLGGLIGFLSGVFAFLLFHPPLYAFVAALAALLFLIVLLHCFKPQYSFARLSALVALMFIIGLLRAHSTLHISTPHDLAFYNGQSVQVEGVITEVDVRLDQVKYKVRIDQLFSNHNADVPNDLKGRATLLITANKYPRYAYGDRLNLKGDLQDPGSFNGFSYRDYLSRFDVYSVMYRPRIQLISSGHGHFFWTAMTFMQHWFQNRINHIVPEPFASFEAGLLVGTRSGIPDDLMEQFNQTGLTHIIAISGYNITIIITFVMWLLAWLPRRIRFWIAVLAIILFTLFVGASPAVVRASIMGILGLMALNAGRQTHIHTTLFFSAALMVLWNPKILWWDVGFQLSFAAVMGLVYVAPLFERYATFLPQAFGIREAIQMTLSAQVIALPIILFHFERLSLIAPLANLLVAFAIPPAMLFGFSAVLVSLFSATLSWILGYVAWGFLNYIIQAIHWMAAVPFASIDVIGIRLWMVFIYYLFLILLLNRRAQQKASAPSAPA